MQSFFKVFVLLAVHRHVLVLVTTLQDPTENISIVLTVTGHSNEVTFLRDILMCTM